MEAKNTKRNVIALALKVVSILLFAVFALAFSWAVFMIVDASAPHDPSDLNGLVSLLGFMLLAISAIPLVLGTITWIIYGNVKKKLAASPPTQTTKTETQNPEVIQPQSPEN